ncbi:MAG: 6-carboxytetrahydropterin synthase [Bacteroidales bacterium]|jgi:6-pyruvoyltetrahydropterin/6-carboxytetrahydropterin synthase|nr:6-carboxytetrahydropterin synthase [Bacteroidales bacterium]MDI9592261.1 6-carboxytetrahydropterin synthase [Bacteroidota bacterium]NLH32769.1 6-carboxytetrahydropterin synthase [Lentimicrobium sp.]OQC38492.1 MAG: 6-pyruvoyl tetrahydropterin synthase [Bacteroidetes bacterium ADurb.Bin041]MBP7873609.1 6-carboxytetrahydropterin synthase [Bacteroidales bacterium]
MAKIRITKAYKFDMAHALPGHDGLCKNIHGHSYELLVTLIGEPINDQNSPKNGMVIDFKDLKKIIKDLIVDQFDHSLVLRDDTPEALLTQMQIAYSRIILVNYQPTSENMIIDFANRIKNRLPDNVKLHHLKLWETVTSYTEWYAEDNE